jgi:hypothetical protein
MERLRRFVERIDVAIWAEILSLPGCHFGCGLLRPLDNESFCWKRQADVNLFSDWFSAY